MITNRKGLSDVVTTVLIILLVLAAVVIVGNYVLQLVTKGGEKISGATICQGLSAEVVSCKKNVAAIDGNVVYKVTAGDASKIKAMKILKYQASGVSTATDLTTAAQIPALYGSLSLTVAKSTPLGSPVYTEPLMTQASVAITSVTTDDGTVTECTSKESVKVTCVD